MMSNQLKNELISIVVPIYKTEEYLEKCIESIRDQTYKNLEIILVNDGSPDNSKEICEKYAKLDERIKLINKENGGLSDARNEGIKVAKGEYIGFVDSDDYIDEDMFEVLYNLITENNVDISMVSYREIINGKVVRIPANDGKTIVYSKIEALKELLLNLDIENYAWNKLYKTKLFDGVTYPKGRNFEDIATTYKLFEKTDKIAYKSEPKYNYVKRGNSIVNTCTYDGLIDYIFVTEDRYKYFAEKYPKLEKENDLAFVSNMVIIYRKSIVYNIERLFKEYEDKHERLLKCVERNKEFIFANIGNFKLVLLSIILWDKEHGKSVIKELEKQLQLKRK